ncbi:MAG TPA: alpha/beta fold hydrolase [Thermoanaerobaculia bacterium]|nr:alpha/beta fold hydrolase [Thermoanaerobaculia bacterium]
MQRVELPPYSLIESRSGAGTPVVLLHGLSGSSRWWARNVEALAKHHLVAAVDLMGFGRNTRISGLPFILPAFDEVTALLARWIETFGEPVHLMGHSMGGQLAIRLAAERPDLLRSLTLVNAAGMHFQIDPRPHLRAAVAAAPHTPGLARVLVPDALRAGPTSIAIALMRVLHGDMREAMRAIQTPALIVWGADDPLVPVHYAVEMQQLIPGARLEVLPHAAHVAMYEAPRAFNELALAFLDEVEAAPRAAMHEGIFRWGLSGYVDGVAYRESGPRREVVLVHGLGMSSRYFAPLARALFARGVHAIAPDIPGFGESANARAMTPQEHAAILDRWAASLNIRDAMWLGHSLGCNAVAQVENARRRVYAGPIWTQRPWRVFSNLALDAFREPLALYRHVIPAYWRTGFARWWLTWRKSLPDLTAPPPEGEMIAGKRDPLPDRHALNVREVEGAHACVFSHPEGVAALAVLAPSAGSQAHRLTGSE